MLLQPTSTLYLAPAEAAEHAQYQPSIARGLEDAQEPFPFFRLVGVDPDQRWATLQTMPDDHRHCTGALSRFDNLDLRFFVRVEELATMTTREVRVVYPDDTAVTLSAGVPLLLVDGHMNAWVDGFLFPAPVPQDAYAFAYEPEPHFALGGRIALLNDVKWHGVRFAGVTHDKMPLARFPDELLPIYARRPLAEKADAELVTLRTSCAQFEVVVARSAIEPGADDGALVGDEAGIGGIAPRVHKGVKVYARGGELVGVVREDLLIFEREAPDPSRRCFLYPLRQDGPGFTLCYDYDDVGR